MLKENYRVVPSAFSLSVLLLFVYGLVPSGCTSDLVTAVPTPTAIREQSLDWESVRVIKRESFSVEGITLPDKIETSIPPNFSPDGSAVLLYEIVYLQNVKCGGVACSVPIHNLWKVEATGGGLELFAERVILRAQWSFDGRQIAFVTREEDGTLSLWAVMADGTNKRLIAKDRYDFQWLARDEIAFRAHDHELGVINTITGASRQILLPEMEYQIREFSMSPDGQFVGFGTDGGIAWLMRVGSAPVKITPYDGAYWGQLRWSSDGKMFAFASRGAIYLVQKDSTASRQLSSTDTLSALQWSPDGRWLAFIGQPEPQNLPFEVYLVDVKTGQLKKLTDDQNAILEQGEKSALTWHPDGTKLYYGLRGNYPQVIELGQ